MERLVVLGDFPTEYTYLERKFQAVTLRDSQPWGESYKLLVDLPSGQIEEDITSLLDADGRARESKYGKLDPALFKRLEQLDDTTTLPVAIWTTAKKGQTLGEFERAAFTQLEAEYPEAKAAVAQGDKPLNVKDPTLAVRLNSEYRAIIKSAIGARTQHIVTELRLRTDKVITFETIPTVAAILSKRDILELNQREDVGAIYLIEERATATLASAAKTLRAHKLWNRGLNGNGITIAILEQANVSATNTFLNHHPVKRNGNGGDPFHATAVASVAASTHVPLKGVAPGATVLSVGHNGSQDDAVAALEWIANGADVINHSEEFGFLPRNEMTWTDQAFDYWARENYRLIVGGSGFDTHTELGNSQKGWNVLTVGGFNDNNTSQWADDTMDPGSPFVNPFSPHNDREKPEVVAVSVDVTALTVNNGIENRTGTSVASPQIAGLAALLMKRNADLKSWPEATTAIIMAAALHNIEGPTDIVPGQDLKDGAGSPNGVLADNTAIYHNNSATTPCNQPCWWGIGFSTGGAPFDRFIQVGANKRVRVAIRWWSHADCRNRNNCFYDRLDSDLDLEVLAPGGNYVPGGSIADDGEDGDGGNSHGSVSQSWDNNYELVDFVAPVAGVYTIRIKRHRVDNTEIQNWVGVAAWMRP